VGNWEKECRMRLLIADSDPLILRSLKIYLSCRNDIDVVGLIADGLDAVDMCRAENPDEVLLDCRLDSVAITQQIKAHCPDTQVIILTLFGITPEVQQAINAGAKGYIAKTDKIENIIENLRTIAGGGRD